MSKVEQFLNVREHVRDLRAGYDEDPVWLLVAVPMMFEHSDIAAPIALFDDEAAARGYEVASLLPDGERGIVVDGIARTYRPGSLLFDYRRGMDLVGGDNAEEQRVRRMVTLCPFDVEVAGLPQNPVLDVPGMEREERPLTIEEVLLKLFAAYPLGQSEPGILSAFPADRHADVGAFIEQARRDDRIDWYMSDDDPPVPVYHTLRAKAPPTRAAESEDADSLRLKVDLVSALQRALRTPPTIAAEAIDYADTLRDLITTWQKHTHVASVSDRVSIMVAMAADPVLPALIHLDEADRLVRRLIEIGGASPAAPDDVMAGVLSALEKRVNVAALVRLALTPGDDGANPWTAALALHLDVCRGGESAPGYVMKLDALIMRGVNSGRVSGDANDPLRTARKMLASP